MSKAKRAACLVLALVSCCACLTSCHGRRTSEAFSVPEAFDENREYEITFWAKNDTNKAQTLIYDKAARDFEALYPNVKVNIRLYTDYGKIYNDVITNIKTKTTPNVCVTYPDHIATYLTGQNVVVPLDSLIADERYGLGGSELRFDGPRADEVVPEYLEECRIGGTAYALPYMRSTEACYINKTFVEKLGYEVPDVLTWDWIWEVSDKAAEKDADGVYALNGQKVLIPFIYKSTDNMMIQMLRQKGAPYSTPDGDILLFGQETQHLLLEVAEHVRKGAFSTFKISGYPANFLNAGQCVFGIDSTAGSTWMGSSAPLLDISPDRLVRFETAVRPVPQFDPEHPQMISQGPSVCVFNKDDPGEVLASWLFAQFLLTDGVQIAYSKTEGYVPVTEKARGSAEYLDYLARAGEDANEHYSVKMDAVKLLLEHTKDTFVTPVFNGSASLRDAAGDLIENVTKSVRRKQPVDEGTVAKLYGDMTSLYRLEKKDAGPLPAESVALLCALGGAWVLISAYALREYLRARRHRQ